jgi:hypothetical protein
MHVFILLLVVKKKLTTDDFCPRDPVIEEVIFARTATKQVLAQYVVH